MDDPLDLAATVLAEDPICDRCLGRRVAQRSHGLTNAERGAALRTAVALREDVPADELAAPPEGDCWVCDGAFAAFDGWADAVVAALEPWAFDTFQVGTRVPPLIEENEALLDEIDGGDDAGRFKGEFNRSVGKRVEPRVDAAAAVEAPDVTAVVDLHGATEAADGGSVAPSSDDVGLQIRPLYVYGRYRKLERGIPQTTWHCRDCRGAGCERCDGTGKTYEDSVEEHVAAPFLDATDGQEFVFHGAGREDVDARMLGDGRPFVAEVKRPRRRDVDLDAVREAVGEGSDGAVEIGDLAFVEGGMVERVKGLDARKRYRARLDASPDEVAEGDVEAAAEALVGATVAQRTPFRVEHRRADKVRERDVHDASVDVEDGALALEVETDGGLYVKELVSGDRGRTEPSLSAALGEDVTVEALDVVAVEGDFLEDGSDES